MADVKMGPVEALLREAKDRGAAVLFIPDGRGWKVCYASVTGDLVDEGVFEVRACDLGSGYDLETAALAAFRPLVELTDG